jgi:hypothetical protein
MGGWNRVVDSKVGGWLDSTARHDAANVTQGRIWGQGGAPPLDFMRLFREHARAPIKIY